jgi:molybdate/tungstate transport system substrate-binding protein
LRQATPDRYERPKEADLTALVQAGELDYAFSYLSIAKASGLKYVELPSEVGLGDPSLAEWYSQARVRLPGALRAGADSVEFRGEPIVYAFTIPGGAPHQGLAEAFARFVLSGRGRVILMQAGLIPLERPLFGGPGEPPASLRAASSAPH